MLKFGILFGLIGVGVFLMRSPAAAADNRLSPAPEPHIKPVNVAPAPFGTVSGTITVRLNGVLSNPQHITYVFSPEFRANRGSLKKADEGTYFLEADNVPLDRPYTLSVSATYNDSVLGRDGVIEVRGRTYTGAIKIQVPFARDFDFGQQFLDLR